MKTRPLLLALVVLGLQTGFAKGENKIAEPQTSAVQAINTAVDQLEKRISENDKTLPALKTEFDYHDATEGVPPSFSFYFETREGKAILRACKSSVGKEVFSVEHIYYFDGEGRLMKYLRKDSGVSGEGGHPSNRSAIIYDKAGRTLWKSGETTSPHTTNEIKKTFETLNSALNKVQ